MNITVQRTSRGKEIYRLSPGDLIDAVASGTRLRASCPIHGGDHQRSLSIDQASGWGFCHCCHAVVLVEAIASPLAISGAAGSTFRKQSTAEARPAPAAPSHLARPATILHPSWQHEEVVALQAAAPWMRETLAASRRVQRYLDERGIPLAIALASGLGYLSRVVWEQISSFAARDLLKRWIGRLVFPLSSPFGRGFIGRSLLKWEPGMDENTHKALLDRPGAPRRWIKTNPAGWFCAGTLPRVQGPPILVEGGFDRLALLSAGMPAESVIALVGTAARSSWLRWLVPQVGGVVLALDADSSGEQAMERLAGEFQQAGLAVSLCPPPHDQWGKDWSERWRRLGPQSLWPLYEILARQEGRK